MLPESLESRTEGLSKENMPGILVSGSQFLRRLLLLHVACALEVQGLTVQKDLSANPFPQNSDRDYHEGSGTQHVTPATLNQLAHCCCHNSRLPSSGITQ